LSLALVSIFIVAPLSSLILRERKMEEGAGVEWESASGESEKNDIISNSFIVDKKWASTEWTPSLALKSLRFWWLALMCLTLGFYCYTILAHQVAYITDAGYSRAFGARIVAIFCIMATMSSFCAFISDYLGRELTFTLSSICTSAGLFIMMLIKNSLHPWMPYLYAIIFGYGYGLSIAMMAVTSADLFQGKNYGAINGIYMSLFVIGGAFGPWLAGYIFDRTKSYDMIFPFLYLAIIASTSFIWLASPGKVRLVPGKVKHGQSSFK
jgi:MFS family permease